VRCFGHLAQVQYSLLSGQSLVTVEQLKTDDLHYIQQLGALTSKALVLLAICCNKLFEYRSVEDIA
jgi:hypothetical protein